MDLQTQLDSIKTRNNNAINSKARLEGQLEEKKSIMLEFGCKTIEELKLKVEELEKESIIEEKRLTEEIGKLNEYLGN